MPYQHYNQNNYGQLCLQFLQTINLRIDIALFQLNIHSWDLYEYSLLSTAKHTWTIKTATQLEKSRYVIFGLQTDNDKKIS